MLKTTGLRPYYCTDHKLFIPDVSKYSGLTLPVSTPYRLVTTTGVGRRIGILFIEKALSKWERFARETGSEL